MAALVLATLVGSGARAEPATGLGHHLLHGERLFDDPGGARTRLEELGITFQLFYHQYLSWKPAGGGVSSNSDTGHSGSYDLFGLFDVESLVGWPGAGLLLHVKGQYDRNVNDSVGAIANPIDDADFDEPIYVDELFLQQRLWDDRLRFRIGFLEQQTVFDRNAFANSEDRQFMNTFLDNNGVVPLPNGLGATLIAAPIGGVELAFGAADADNRPRNAGFDTFFDGADSLTGYFELTLRPHAWGILGGRRGAYRVGGFVDGRKLERFGTDDGTGEPILDRGHWGAYLSFDQIAWSENGRDDQGLGLFGRFGYADPDVNEVAWFWSLGLQLEGLLPRRDRDRIALGVYQAIRSSRYRAEVDPDFERETGIELYCRIQALPWLAVTPDFQYIIDPGADGEADDAMVVSLRLRVEF